MNERFDRINVFLYAGAVMLFCLLIVSVREAKEKAGRPLPQATPALAATAVPEVATAGPAEPCEGHRPHISVSHSYAFDADGAVTVPHESGMLSEEDMSSSRYFSRPSGPAEHVFREENGIYDRLIYGTGPVGSLDAWAKYVFRYDPVSGKAVAFIQEQHIDTGPGMNADSLSVYADAAGYLPDAVFSGTDTDPAADREKIRELAQYFFGSYIPAHPVVPAVLHFRMPAYMLTFVMDTDVFIILISPDGVPRDYTVENDMD